MNLHKHARLTPRGRALFVQRIVEHGLRVEEAAHASGVSVRTAYKWLARYRLLGEDGLQDRSSRPQRCPHATKPELVEQILQQRQQRSTYGHIAAHLQVGRSTIARIVRRAGLHRLAELEPRPPVVRYQVTPEKPPDHIHCKASSALSVCWNCQFSLRYVLVSGSFRPCVH
ncbi:leucine zipper domain-containing protein, partial [Xanthomonas oryzae]|uniref:leucine zipper domain-containing protein n=1 Tax=Xanthomonas oryzae TaxID=347 RepID=UPI000A69EAE5